MAGLVDLVYGLLPTVGDVERGHEHGPTGGQQAQGQAQACRLAQHVAQRRGPAADALAQALAAAAMLVDGVTHRHAAGGPDRHRCHQQRHRERRRPLHGKHPGRRIGLRQRQVQQARHGDGKQPGAAHAQRQGHDKGQQANQGHQRQVDANQLRRGGTQRLHDTDLTHLACQQGRQRVGHQHGRQHQGHGTECQQQKQHGGHLALVWVLAGWGHAQLQHRETLCLQRAGQRFGSRLHRGHGLGRIAKAHAQFVQRAVFAQLAQRGAVQVDVARAFLPGGRQAGVMHQAADRDGARHAIRRLERQTVADSRRQHAGVLARGSQHSGCHITT